MSARKAQETLTELANASEIDAHDLVRLVLIAHLVELGEHWPTARPSDLAADVAIGEYGAGTHVRRIVDRITKEQAEARGFAFDCTCEKDGRVGVEPSCPLHGFDVE